MKKAFTLVEMLVAIILLSLLIGVAVFSFKMQLMSIHKTKETGIVNIIEYVQLRSLLESIKFYVVDKYDVINRPMKNPHLFFHGSTNKIVFITTNPIYSNSDALVELKCDNGKLLYKEEALFFKMNYLQPSFSEAANTKVFYQNLKECSFKFILDKRETTNMFNKIPKDIELKIEKEDKNIYLYVQIKSDDYGILRKVKDAIYKDTK